MEIKVTITNRNNSYEANAVYEDGKITVLKGGYISEDFADHIRGGQTAKSYRENAEFVGENRKVIKDCTFSSPSTAAQFVTGRSTNGYKAWKVEPNKSLGKYLEENGLR